MLIDYSKKFFVLSLGCRVNKAEIDDYSAYLISNDWELSDVYTSSLIVLNSCTVTSTADKKTRQSIRKICRSNTNMNTKIIVTGCACAINPEYYKQIDDRIRVVPKLKMIDEIKKLCNNKNVDYKYHAKVLTNENFRTRAAIKIQDGCNNNCSYCIVHTARGKSWSLPHDQIERKFSAYLDAGIKEVVLTGVNLGAYNDKGLDLSSLCQKLLCIVYDKFDIKNNNVPARIRLSSIEPQNITDQLIDVIKRSKGIICKYFHLPLQSGSSNVLNDMNRLYNAQDFENLVMKLKENLPSLAISTDIIVGFPGETSKDFEATCNLAKKCGFMKIHVFPYSKRENTPAAARNDQVEERIKVKRAFELRQIDLFLAKQDLESRINTQEYALCEKSGFARLESYHLIKVDNSYIPGELFNIYIK